MKLDLYDRKILYYLDMNSRYTLGELGKLVRLSKNAISHRIKNLVKEGIIRKFYSVINTQKLGYSYFKVYFKLQNTNEKSEKEIIDYIINKIPSLWVNSWEGRYDLMAGILAKNIEEFYEILNSLINKFRKNIQSYDIFIVISAPHFKKNYLLEQSKSQAKIEEFGGKTEIIEVDDIDRKILKEMAENSRIQIVELVEKINSTIDIIRYRLKKLNENEIIQGYRILIDYPKINYQLYKVLISAQNLDKEAEKKIIEYCSSIPNIADIIIRGIGSWNIELQIDAKNSQEFHNIFKDFKNKFNNLIKSHETLLMINEYKLNYFPF
ncbi:Lrp/AsnC family transcriptional regulator [Candidatus Pacearchaeota archaeon]|nr:Lrp/AsnC family transcriptional regulator [Candidatus Pacearchaeota archaeon]